MAKTLDLFPDSIVNLDSIVKVERKKPRVMMHVFDAGDCIARYRCSKCGIQTWWLPVTTITEGKRGVPCGTCNQN